MPLKVSGKTRVYGIFGDPVSHSLSPLMQNAAFSHFGIDAVYVPFHVSPPSLPAAVTALRSLDIAGINVTIPHKENILPLLDHVDPLAARIGAVNTLIQENGILTGYNTDASGFLRSLENELGFVPRGKRALLLGAGGACRAAVCALLDAGIASVVVANRSAERARMLLASFSGFRGDCRFSGVDYSSPIYHDAIINADLIVNTTAVGLQGESVDFLSLGQVKRSAVLYDMVYSRVGTPLIGEARSLGLSCIDGFSLLAAQGEDAFFIWTQQPCPQGFMLEQLLSSQRIQT